MYSIRIWGKGHSVDRILIPEAIKVIERWELFIDHWYPDGIRKKDTPQGPKGSIIYSSMFGHAEGGDNPPFKMTPREKFTLEQGRKTLMLDAAVKLRWVNARIKVPLTTFMTGAIVSCVFQFGQGRLDQANAPNPDPLFHPYGSIPFIDLFNAGRYTKALIAMRDLNYDSSGKVLDGLILRRATEVGFAMTRIE